MGLHLSVTALTRSQKCTSPYIGERSQCLPQLCFLSPVVATMRDLGKKSMLEAAAGEALGQTLTVAQLDVCSDESVAQCLSCIRGGEVDVLGEAEQSLGSLYPSLA